MSMFTHRHYVAVADTIGLTLRQIDNQDDDQDLVHHRLMGVERFISNLVVTFKEDNGRFKEDTFNTRIGLIRDEGLQT